MGGQTCGIIASLLGGFVGLFERRVEKSDYFHYFPVLGINATKVVKYCHARFPKEFGLEDVRCLESSRPKLAAPRF